MSQKVNLNNVLGNLPKNSTKKFLEQLLNKNKEPNCKEYKRLTV